MVDSEETVLFMKPEGGAWESPLVELKGGGGQERPHWWGLGGGGEWHEGTHWWILRGGRGVLGTH